MATSLEEEAGALTIMQWPLQGNQSNQGSLAAHVTAWRLDDRHPMSPSARSSYIRRWLSSQDARISSNSNNTSDEFHIPVLDDDLESCWPAHTHISISQASYYASSLRERERAVLEPLLNRPRLTEAFLVIAAQVALTLTTVGPKVTTSGSSSLSTNANLLLEFAMISNVTGFLCCLYGILLCGHKPGVAARILTGVGYAAIVFGIIAIMCTQLLERLMFWFTAVTCIVALPALAAAFHCIKQKAEGFQISIRKAHICKTIT